MSLSLNPDTNNLLGSDTSQTVKVPTDVDITTPYHHRFPYLKRRAIIPALALDGDSEGKSEDVDPDCKVDLNNVQGDVYFMFPKVRHAIPYFVSIGSLIQLEQNFEQFIFFVISDLAQFKKDLDTYRPYVTTSKQTVDNIKKIADRQGGEELDIVSTGIAFSKVGLKFMGVTYRLGDKHFDNGPMIKEKSQLGDTGKWDDVFNDGKVHGAILVTAGSECISSLISLLSLNIDDILQKRRPARAKLSSSARFSRNRLKTKASPNCTVVSGLVTASILDGGMVSPNPLSSTLYPPYIISLEPTSFPQIPQHTYPGPTSRRPRRRNHGLQR